MEKRIDAILVPGGGVQSDGTVTPWVARRLDKAVELWRDSANPDGTVGKDSSSSPYVVTLSAGTTHKPPPTDGNGFVVYECTASARYLVRSGVPASVVLQEWTSYDTIGNAYFARVQHTDPRAWHQLVVVTSDFHMPRTRAIFDWVFHLPNHGLPLPPYDLQFISVSDEGTMDDDTLKARCAKEQKSLEMLLQTKAAIKTLAALHQFLFRDHAAYATRLQTHSRPSLSAEELKSY